MSKDEIKFDIGEYVITDFGQVGKVCWISVTPTYIRYRIRFNNGHRLYFDQNVLDRYDSDLIASNNSDSQLNF